MYRLFIFLVLSSIIIILFAQSPQKLHERKSYPQHQELIRSLLVKHSQFYKNSDSNTKTQYIANSVRSDFIKSVVDLSAYWVGTAWSYNGTSQIPQQGSIACGYFVTTLLEDVGLQLSRAKLAQQASENIIKSLSHEKHITRYRNKNLKSFVESINKLGEGLYVVGLDYHVGFLWHDGNTVHFIHSTFVTPGGVIHEPASTSPVLAASNYRVVGKISDNDALLKKWLQGNTIATVGKH